MTQKDFHFNSKASTFEKAKALRQRETKEEKILWKKLRNRNFKNLKFRRQHPIENYIVDFYCHELKLVIEVDGGIHNTLETEIYDKERGDILEELGLTVIRFKNEDVNNNLLEVLRKLDVKCEELKNG